VQGYDPVRVQEEHGEEGALRRSAERSVLAPVADAEGAEYPKLHRNPPLELTPN
jgi:hypothetical protein